MELTDIWTDFALGIIYGVFGIYNFIAHYTLRIFFPLTKHLVDKKLNSIGITVNGKKPTDIQVKKENEKKFYCRVALEGTFGILDSKLDQEWDTKDLIGFVKLVMGSRRLNEFSHPLTWTLNFFNLQTRAKAWEVGEKHYDDASDCVRAMIDKNLQYTCGYWKNAKNLDEAQIAKMDLIAQKLKLQPGMKVLDIGCGYGTLGVYLAKNYGVSVVGCSISKEMTNYAHKISTGLPCDFRLCDYRDMNEQFDRIVSVGMFEHVGSRNFREFFEVSNRCLKDDGIFLLHTVGNNHMSNNGTDTWTCKYIFPNGHLPYYLEVCHALEGKFIIEDWHNFGMDYAKTFAAWEVNFDRVWPTLKGRYDDRFQRKWKIFLQTAQGMFLAREMQLWQIVLSKDGLSMGYDSVR